MIIPMKFAPAFAASSASSGLVTPQTLMSVGLGPWCCCLFASAATLLCLSLPDDLQQWLNDVCLSLSILQTKVDNFSRLPDYRTQSSPVMSRGSYRCEMTRSDTGVSPQHCIAAAILRPAESQ